jgi:5-methylcytosine-specific restriction enzyme subunit McrC
VLPAEHPVERPAHGPKVYSAREYAPVDVPLADLLDARGRLRLNPDVESKGYFTIQLAKGLVRLQASGYVGLIPLNDRVVIDVRPRVPVANLNRLLRLSEYVPPALRVERPYALEGEPNDSLLDLYARWLVARVEEIASSGLFREYERREEVTSFPRGRIRTDATLTQVRARGINHRAISNWYERTPDTPPNRCLKYALWFIAGRLSRLGARITGRRELLQRLGALYGMFGGVELEHSLSFLNDPVVTGAKPLPSLRQYYRPALELAVAIIRQHAVDLEAKRHVLDLPSLVLNMNRIFENYLRNVLRADAVRQGWATEILDGNSDGKKPLFDVPPSEDATPDIVCRDRGDGSYPLVVEVKNIPVHGNSSRAAIEQAVTYAATYRCPRVVLAHPRAHEQSFSGLRLQGTIGPLSVYQYVFDLSAGSLAAEETAFADHMHALV